MIRSWLNPLPPHSRSVLSETRARPRRSLPVSIEPLLYRTWLQFHQNSTGGDRAWMGVSGAGRLNVSLSSACRWNIDFRFYWFHKFNIDYSTKVQHEWVLTVCPFDFLQFGPMLAVQASTVLMDADWSGTDLGLIRTRDSSWWHLKLKQNQISYLKEDFPSKLIVIYEMYIYNIYIICGSAKVTQTLS